ncbi:M48 family metallopeptidase [Tateyamaria armeniaca]|uniref:M48 family metallopeptidase n=1 Tax=Tateyamaria armeniaca TaxID=2518930 RepID=A0ABW8UR53_9RHOB
MQRVEPVAERECIARTSGVRCDFGIFVDTRNKLPANAFQTLDDEGRPILVFTSTLLFDARNADEIAFVMAHEVAHHIEGHISRQKRNVAEGARVFAEAEARRGGNAKDVEYALLRGAQVGAFAYPKIHELEADALGTIIAARSGFDPVKGAEFFNRIPDPGDRFLGTHPPNAQRIETVRRTAAGL